MRSRDEPAPKKPVEVIELSDSDDDEPLVRVEVSKAKELKKVGKGKGKERAVDEPVEPVESEQDALSNMDTSAPSPAPPPPRPLRSMSAFFGDTLNFDDDELDDESESAAVNGMLVSKA